MKKFLAPVAAAAAAGVASLGMLATPAQASVSYGGCTATPHLVRYYDHLNGQKRVLLRADVHCHVDRWVHLAQQGWEDDDRPGDRQDDRWYSTSQWIRVDAGTTRRVDRVVAMPDTPGDGAEELYQQARFQVRTIEPYPVTSSWTRWDATRYQIIAN